MNPLLLLFPYSAIASQLLPVAAVATQWRRTTPARRWIAVWFLSLFLSDILQMVATRLWGNNLWFFTYADPVEDALLLWALSFWQVRPEARITFRVAIPLVVVTYLAIVIVSGEHETFKVFAGTFRALIMLVATLYTLLTNLARDPEHAWNHDWLWTSFGLTLFWGVSVALRPIAEAARPYGNDTLIAVWSVKSSLDVVAFFLVWRGMRCPLPTRSSASI